MVLCWGPCGDWNSEQGLGVTVSARLYRILHHDSGHDTRRSYYYLRQESPFISGAFLDFSSFTVELALETNKVSRENSLHFMASC